MIDFVKNLSASESKYKYVGLPKETRSKFPAKDKIFKVKFQGRTYKIKVNNKNCIMLTQLYTKYQFKNDDELRIIINKEKVFEFIVNTSKTPDT